MIQPFRAQINQEHRIMVALETKKYAFETAKERTALQEPQEIHRRSTNRKKRIWKTNRKIIVSD